MSWTQFTSRKAGWGHGQSVTANGPVASPGMKLLAPTRAQTQPLALHQRGWPISAAQVTSSQCPFHSQAGQPILPHKKVPQLHGASNFTPFSLCSLRKGEPRNSFQVSQAPGLGVLTYQCWTCGSHGPGLAAPQAGLGQKVHLQDRESVWR